MRRASIIVDLEKCSKKCLFFYQGEGNGHCDDWCTCKKYNALLEKLRQEGAEEE